MYWIIRTFLLGYEAGWRKIYSSRLRWGKEAQKYLQISIPLLSYLNSRFTFSEAISTLLLGCPTLNSRWPNFLPKPAIFPESFNFYQWHHRSSDQFTLFHCIPSFINLYIPPLQCLIFQTCISLALCYPIPQILMMILKLVVLSAAFTHCRPLFTPIPGNLPSSLALAMTFV